MPINMGFFTYSLHRVNIPVTYPHIDTRQVGCSFLKLIYFPIRVKPCFLPVYRHLGRFCNKKEDFPTFCKSRNPLIFIDFRVVVQSHPSDFAHGRPPIFCRTGKLPRAPKKLGRLRVVVGLVSASGLAFA